MKPTKIQWTQVKETLLLELERKQLVLFLGAGISLWKPSSLPSGMELLQGVIGGLLSGIDVTSYQHCFNEVYRYTPEIVFQAIYESLPERTLLLNIYKALEGVSPNLCHLVLGTTASQGWQTLITTNQDCLIEQSVMGCINVAYAEDQFQLKADPPQIFKLHGSAGGTEGEEQQKARQSIQLTLHQMGAGLSDRKRRVMQEVFALNDLLFIGYSGGDYDVCQFLDSQLQRSEKRIFWNVRPGVELRTQHPHIWQLQLHYPDRVVVFEKDLRDLFLEIAMVWGVQVGSEVIKAAYCDNAAERWARIEQFVLPWASDLSRFQKLLTLGWILFSTNMPSIADEFAREAIASSGSPLEKGMGLLLLGYACRERSMHRESLKHLWEAHECFDRANDQYRKAQVLHKIGEVSSTREMMTLRHFVPHPRVHRGIRHLRRALDLYQANRDDEHCKGMQRATAGWAVLNEAQILPRIGWHWQHLVPLIGRFVAGALNARAKVQLVKARDILERSGDLRGVAQVHIALADLEPEAGHAEQGSTLSGEWTIDLVHQGNSLYRQAAQSERTGDLESAKVKLEEALQCYTQVGVQAEMATMAALLANLCMRLHDVQQTETYLTICLEAKKKTRGSYLWNLIAWGFLLKCRLWLWFQNLILSRGIRD